MKHDVRSFLTASVRLLDSLAIWLMLAFTGLAMLEVIRRHVFGVSFMWQQDIVTLGVLSGVYLFFSHTERADGQVRVTFVTDMLAKRGGRALSVVRVFDIVARTASVVFGCLVVLYGVPTLLRYVESNILLPSQVLPLWPFFLVYLVGFLAYLVTCVIRLWAAARRRSTSDTGVLRDTV